MPVIFNSTLFYDSNMTPSVNKIIAVIQYLFGLARLFEKLRFSKKLIFGKYSKVFGKICEKNAIDVKMGFF